MTLRFLQACASEHPDYPFMAGQIVHLPRLTTAMKTYIKKGWAILVNEEPERAIVRPSEQRWH